MAAAPRLGEILQQRFGLGDDALNNALERQQDSEQRIGELLLEQQAITSQQLSQALAEQLGLDYLDSLPEVITSEDLLSLIPLAYARQTCGVPLESR